MFMKAHLHKTLYIIMHKAVNLQSLSLHYEHSVAFVAISVHNCVTSHSQLNTCVLQYPSCH